MMKLVKYITLVLLGVAIIDISCRLFFQYQFNHPRDNSRISAIYKFVFHSDSDEVVILGASRADRHYVSQQIEDSLCVKVFNYGFEGCSIVHQYFSLLKAIGNGNLKLAILDLSTAQLGEEWVHDRLSRYYPYYWRSDTIRNVINEIEGMDMRYFMLSSLFQYNSQLFNIFIKDKQDKGFSPLPFTGKPVKKVYSDMDPSIEIEEIKKNSSPYAIKYLKLIKYECDKNKVQLVVCNSPSLYISEGNDQYIEELCKQLNIKCWNFGDSLSNSTLFSNMTHLNERGAEEFSGMLAHKIRKEFSLLISK